MTKAAAIRQTHIARPWLTPEQIGELMGCAAGYVRLVLDAKQQKSTGQHEQSGY